MLDAERAEVLRLRDEGRADQTVLRVVLGALDLEETMLERIDDREERLSESQVLPVEIDPGAVRPPRGGRGVLRQGDDAGRLRGVPA